MVVRRKAQTQTAGAIGSLATTGTQKLSKIKLQEGLSLDYVLRNNDVEAVFLINTLKDSTVQIELV